MQIAEYRLNADWRSAFVNLQSAFSNTGFPAPFLLRWNDMRTSFLAAVVLASAAVVSAQQPAPKTDTAKPKKPTPITMSGCVQKSEVPGGGYTLFDGTTQFRLTGVDVRDYVGHHVEVVGGDSRKLKIVGGLLPSANVAGQAGNMDPARAATKGADTSTVNGTGTPEFRVRSIKPTQGSCTQ